MARNCSFRFVNSFIRCNASSREMVARRGRSTFTCFEVFTFVIRGFYNASSTSQPRPVRRVCRRARRVASGELVRSALSPRAVHEASLRGFGSSVADRRSVRGHLWLSAHRGSSRNRSCDEETSRCSATHYHRPSPPVNSTSCAISARLRTTFASSSNSLTSISAIFSSRFRASTLHASALSS